jgi:hypothetical protein
MIEFTKIVMNPNARKHGTVAPCETSSFKNMVVKIQRIAKQTAIRELYMERNFPKRYLPKETPMSSPMMFPAYSPVSRV